MSVTDSMRSAANILEFVAKLYNLSPVGKESAVRLSADWLRIEAAVLDRPIPEESDD